MKLQHYEGLWQDGLMHGDGIYILQDGSKYEGQFKEGKRDGEGRYTWVDGRKYEGQFKNDLIDGVGTMWNQKENIKVFGQYKNGKMHGKITIETGDGKTSTAIYNEGNLVENQ